MELTSKASPVSHLPAVKRIDVGSLVQCAALMGPVEVESFDQTYGNIRRLLQLEVQESALVALSQFYDSDTRCFFLKNFQLSPTLEEYDQLLGLSRSQSMPYQYQGQYYTDKKLAMLLRIGVDKLKQQKLERNGISGYPQDYFEGLMRSYASVENWGPFKLVLALTIFGVILFPQIERYIDVDAIGVFLVFKDAKNPVNPVPAVLANTYHAFTRCSQYRKKKMCLSSHMLYAWLLIHIIHNKKNVQELISYALSCDVKNMTSLEWVEFLRKLDNLQIRWFHFACWKDRPKVVFSCGDFQNVPLMGTQGCINYNPSLTLRQLGYPMRNSPSECMLSCLYLYKGMPECEDLLRRVQHAWESVVYKGSEELSQRTGDVSFSQWLKEKLQSVKTPSQGALSLKEKIPEPYIPTFEEMNEIKAALAKADEEKKALRIKLEEVTVEKEKLEEENAIKMVAVKESVKRYKVEEENKLEAQKYLRGARDELQRYKQKARKALEEAQEWKVIATESRPESSLVLELRNQLRSLERERGAIDEILKEYQQILRHERGISEGLKRDLQCVEDAYRQVRAESQHWHECFMALIGKVEDQEIVKELREDIQFWKSKFFKLSELTDRTMVGFPRSLRKAEAGMHFPSTPPEVCQFMDFCRALVTEVKEQMRDATVSKKRKQVGNFKALCI